MKSFLTSNIFFREEGSHEDCPLADLEKELQTFEVLILSMMINILIAFFKT